MELSQLRYFLEAARQQHITKSAEAMNVVQPAITRAINRLEDELGVQLFTPQGRGIRLTDCGKFLYDRIRPLMEELDVLPEKIREVAHKEQVVVHMNILSAWTLVTEAIIEYQRIDHLLHIELIETKQTDMADINITTQRAEQKKARDNARLFREQIFLAVPNTPRYQGRTSINLQDVRESRFITLSGVKHYRAICDRFCAAAGIRPHYVFESDSPAAVMNAISVGMGVGFWPAFSWGRVDPRRILLLEVEQPRCFRDIIISYNRIQQDNVHIRLFYDFLIRYFEIYSTRALSEIHHEI